MSRWPIAPGQNPNKILLHVAELTSLHDRTYQKRFQVTTLCSFDDALHNLQMPPFDIGDRTLALFIAEPCLQQSVEQPVSKWLTPRLSKKSLQHHLPQGAGVCLGMLHKVKIRNLI